MPPQAYSDGGAGHDLSPPFAAGHEFFAWKRGQIAVTRTPACVLLALACLLPIPIFHAAGGSSSEALDRFVGYSSFGPSSSLGLIVAQAAFFLLVARVSRSGLKLNGVLQRLHRACVSSCVGACLLCSVLLCPACLLSFAATPLPHGVTHPTILFAISCFLLDPSFMHALPAAAAALACNACYIANAPRDSFVYHNFMFNPPPSPPSPSAAMPQRHIVRASRFRFVRMWVLLIVAVALLQVSTRFVTNIHCRNDFPLTLHSAGAQTCCGGAGT